MIYFWYTALTAVLIAGGWGIIEVGFTFVLAVILALIIRQY